MSEIQNITPGLVPVGEYQGKRVVSGRALHEFLEVSTAYKDWFPRMVAYGFEEGKDFCSFLSESTGGRPSTDHALTIDMGKELGMIQRTELGRRIRQYFIEVEKQAVVSVPDISTPEGVLALAQTLTQTAEQLVAEKNKVAELTPLATAWNELASAEGDYEVADAAKILARAGVETGRQRLFGQLEQLGWIYRGPQGKWKARQTAVDSGYLAEKPQSHHHPRTGELVLDPPQVRVTVRGLERLRVRLGSVLRAVEAVA